MASDLPHSILPPFLMGADCQLLPQVRRKILRSRERLSTSLEDYARWTDVEEWVLLAQGGAQTLPHQDSFRKATWLTGKERGDVVYVAFAWLYNKLKDLPKSQQRKAKRNKVDEDWIVSTHIQIWPGDEFEENVGSVLDRQDVNTCHLYVAKERGSFMFSSHGGAIDEFAAVNQVARVRMVWRMQRWNWQFGSPAEFLSWPPSLNRASSAGA